MEYYKLYIIIIMDELDSKVNELDNKVNELDNKINELYGKYKIDSYLYGYYDKDSNIYTIDGIPFIIFKNNDIYYFAYIKWLICDKMKNKIVIQESNQFYDEFTYKYYKKRVLTLENYNEIYNEVIEFVKNSNDPLCIVWNNCCFERHMYGYSLHIIKKNGILFYQVLDKFFIYDNELNEYSYELNDWPNISQKMDEILENS